MGRKFIDTYTVFDVETPNAKNDSICSIGIVRVEEGRVVLSKHYYVDPEDRFDPFNVQLHGISRAHVAGKPNFPKLWHEISPWFLQEVVIAHNATFDLRVLSKCFANYAIDVPDFFSLCTLKLSRKWVKELSHHRLNDMCDYFRVDLLQHHNALDDALACQGVFKGIDDRFKTTYDDVEVYCMKNTCIKVAEKPLLSKSLKELMGLMEGFGADGIFDGIERVRLRKWMDDHKKYAKSKPYQEIMPLLKNMLESGEISRHDMETLRLFSSDTGVTTIYGNKTSSMQELKGMVEGIGCNQKISGEEFHLLLHWMSKNNHLKGDPSYDRIDDHIRKIGHDGIMTLLEEKALLEVFQSIINPMAKSQECEKNFKDKKICLTGNFTRGSKESVACHVEHCGGTVTKSLTMTTDILIVGGEGNLNWSYGNYGAKVKRAMELQSKGKDIKIISEEDYYKSYD